MRKSSLWSWLGAATLALGATTTWWAVRGSGAADTAKKKPETAAEAAAKRDPRVRQVLEVARHRSATSQKKLLELYTRWAGDPNATEARRYVLNAMFGDPSRASRLERVLEAVSVDPTPPERDPLWPEIVERLSEQWEPEVFNKGRDLMLMEKRARPRRALIESWTEFAHSDRYEQMTPEQRQGLINDFIDLYPTVDAAEKPKIESAMREIAGDDTADLLANGLKSGQKPKTQVEYEKQLQAWSRKLGVEE
jgi:hypothetical protein